MPSDTSVCKYSDCHPEMHLSKDSKTFQVGRSAKTGQLVKVSYAKAHPSSTVIERMPKTGYGDTKKK